MAFSGAQATLRALRSAAVEEAGKRAEAVARAAEVDRMDGQATVAEVRMGTLGGMGGCARRHPEEASLCPRSGGTGQGLPLTLAKPSERAAQRLSERRPPSTTLGCAALQTATAQLAEHAERLEAGLALRQARMAEAERALAAHEAAIERATRDLHLVFTRRKRLQEAAGATEAGEGTARRCTVGWGSAAGSPSGLSSSGFVFGGGGRGRGGLPLSALSVAPPPA